MSAISNTFQIVLTDETKTWYETQLLACTELTTLAENSVAGTRPAFGMSLKALKNVTPHSTQLSSYVNSGMYGLSLDRLKDMKGKFRYRTTGTPGSIKQFPLEEGGGLYVSGVPGRLVCLHNPTALPDLPIVALIFAYDKNTHAWSVEIQQQATKPRKPQAQTI